MAWTLAIPVIGKLIEMGSTWLNGRVEIQKARTAGKVALEYKKAEGEIDWDIAQARASETSWKDEWLTAVFSIPLVMAFMGEKAQAIVTDGFTAIVNMPVWYQGTIGVIVAASFGYRKAVDLYHKFKSKD